MRTKKLLLLGLVIFLATSVVVSNYLLKKEQSVKADTEGTGPIIISSTPTDGSSNVSIKIAELIADFDNRVNPLTLNETSFTLENLSKDKEQVLGTVSLTPNNKTAKFQLLSDLEYKNVYMACLRAGIEDQSGNKTTSHQCFAFGTEEAPENGGGDDNGNGGDNNDPIVDIDPPILISSSPANGQGNVDVNTVITTTFDEELDASTINELTFTLENNTKDKEQVFGTVTYDNKVATFMPLEGLEYSTVYYSCIRSGVKDLAGNATPNHQCFAFETKAAPENGGGDDDGNGGDNNDPIVGEYLIISDFEDSTLDGWRDDATVVTGGKDSDYALQLVNTANNGAETRKYLNGMSLAGYDYLEFDLGLNGANLKSGDASAVVFEQAGWKMVSLIGYISNGYNGWQKVKIPLHHFSGLDTDQGVAYLLFRFWNHTEMNILIDNIRVSKCASENGLKAPYALTAEDLGDGAVKLMWQGFGPNYNVYLDGVLLGSTPNNYYIVPSLEAGRSYDFYIKATDGVDLSEKSNVLQIKIATPPSDKLAIDMDINLWNDDAVSNLEGGIRLVNQAFGSAETRTSLNGVSFEGKSKIVMDINLNGATLMPSCASTLAFEQAGWRRVSLSSYVINGIDGWQQIEIPLADFTGLDISEGVAELIFRFWNETEETIDIDNIEIK